MSRPRVDLVAVVAAVVVLVMVVVYLWIMRQEPDRPAAWFLAALIVGAAAASYGANPTSPLRGAALVLAGLVLAAVGVFAIVSIGFPILVAGAMCLFAGAGSARHSSAAPSKTR